MKRALLILLLLVLLIPAGLLLAANPILDSAAIRTRIAYAVQRATGHPLRLDGPISVALWSLTPSIAIRDAALLNPPGYTRAELATVRRIDAAIALIPLLSGTVRITAIQLDHPDILLETDAAGRANWLPQNAVPPLTADPTPRAPTPSTPLTIDSLHLTAARIAYAGLPPLTIPALTVRPGGGPLSGTAAVNDTPFTLSGQTGPTPTAPFTLSAVGGGLALTASGTLDNTALTVLAPDTAALAPLFGHPIPSFRDLKATATIFAGDQTKFFLTAGPSTPAPNLTLRHLTIDAPAPAQPVVLTAEGTYRDLPFAFALNAGSLATLLDRRPTALQALLLADQASLKAAGSFGGEPTVTLAATIPDLRRTAARAGLALPPLTNAKLDLRLSQAPSTGTILARGIRFTSDQADLAGDLAATTQPRPTLRGTLVSQRLDLDTILTPPPPPPPATPPTTASIAPTTPAPPPEPAPLPFATLRQADADLRLTIGQATLRATTYRAIETRILLQSGALRIDPARLTAPGGPVSATLYADANPTPPTAAITLQAPGLAAAPVAAALVAAALGHPGALTGLLDLDLQLRAAGATLPAMLPTLTGHAGLALTDGELDNATLATLFGPALEAARLPIDLAGQSRVRCLATRIDLDRGQATVQALALDTTRIRLEGQGSLNLMDRTLDMHLRPTIRIGGASVQAPIHLQGPFARPTPTIERGAQFPGRFGLSLGTLTTPDPCPPALAAARGRAGALPR